jgi:hypothetical protein
MNGITRAVKRMEVGKGRKTKQGARQGVERRDMHFRADGFADRLIILG